MLRPPTSQKAFTLIEVLMAATVLVVSFTAVIQAVMMGAEMIDTARRQQIAQQIIEGEITYQRQCTWNHIGNILSGNGNILIATITGGTNASDNSLTNRRTDIHDLILDENENLMAAAKGFTCLAEVTNLSPRFRSIAYTVTWVGSISCSHTRTGAAAHVGQNGLHLSYQK